MTAEITQIKAVIQYFQDGYRLRDVDTVDRFMNLFCEDGRLEIIGTDAFIKGQGEWCLNRAALKKLVVGDWQGWGDLRLDTEDLTIHVKGEAAWFAATGTVSRSIEPDQSYRNFLGYMKWVTENEPEIPVKEKLLDMLRGGITTLANAEMGATYIWPLRLTAVLVKEAGRWRFCQMTFSFPTIYPPDVRLVE